MYANPEILIDPNTDILKLKRAIRNERYGELCDAIASEPLHSCFLALKNNNVIESIAIMALTGLYKDTYFDYDLLPDLLSELFLKQARLIAPKSSMAALEILAFCTNSKKIEDFKTEHLHDPQGETLSDLLSKGKYQILTPAQQNAACAICEYDPDSAKQYSRQAVRYDPCNIIAQRYLDGDTDICFDIDACVDFLPTTVLQFLLYFHALPNHRISDIEKIMMRMSPNPREDFWEYFVFKIPGASPEELSFLKKLFDRFFIHISRDHVTRLLLPFFARIPDTECDFDDRYNALLDSSADFFDKNNPSLFDAKIYCLYLIENKIIDAFPDFFRFVRKNGHTERFAWEIIQYSDDPTMIAQAYPKHIFDPGEPLMQELCTRCIECCRNNNDRDSLKVVLSETLHRLKIANLDPRNFDAYALLTEELESFAKHEETVDKKIPFLQRIKNFFGM